MRQCVLHQFQAVSLEGCPSVPTVISPLNTSVYFMYLKMYTSTKYKYCITAYLCVSYDFQNQEKIFPYIAIAFLCYTGDEECLLRGRSDYL